MAMNGRLAGMPRDYAAAVEALNTLQSNFSIVDAIRKSGRSMNKNAIPEMVDWCRRIGYEPVDFDKFRPIHVAGTKGKGSTSAFVSSILQQFDHGKVPLRKIGLYTSPHLRSVRERIQINNEPISEDLFARYFFQVWDRLEESAQRLGPQKVDGVDEGPTKPVYFRFLTLVAFHAYLSEGVDTVVIECGIGGEYDSTNVLVSPYVAAVTSLGIDHTAVLGSTIEDIAWHKAGIFKRSVKHAFTVSAQPESALSVLKERAEAAGLQLVKVSRHRDIESNAITLGLAADFQKTNASIATAVAAAFLQSVGVEACAGGAPVPAPGDPTSHLPDEFKRGLANVKWGGRCETRHVGDVTWHIDGGHTMESIRLAAEWFGGCLKGKDAAKRRHRVLLFNQQTRDAVGLARALHATLSELVPPTAGGSQAPLFDQAVFCTNMTFAPKAEGDPAATGRYKPDLVSINTSQDQVDKLTVQQGLATCWKELDNGCAVSVESSIEVAVQSVPAGSIVLATGSLHLVGGLLEVLDTLATT